MANLFVVYSLRKGVKPEEYDTYLTKTKIPALRGESWFIKHFRTYKIDRVVAPAVSPLEGKLPEELPYQYIARIEVSDLDTMVTFLGTEAGKKLIESWSVYIDPTAVFTLGHEM